MIPDSEFWEEVYEKKITSYKLHITSYKLQVTSL
jgi:hypothetical protein